MASKAPNFTTMNNDELRVALQNMYNAMNDQVVNLTNNLANARQEVANANVTTAQVAMNLATMHNGTTTQYWWNGNSRSTRTQYSNGEYHERIRQHPNPIHDHWQYQTNDRRRIEASET